MGSGLPVKLPIKKSRLRPLNRRVLNHPAIHAKPRKRDFYRTALFHENKLPKKRAATAKCKGRCAFFLRKEFYDFSTTAAP